MEMGLERLEITEPKEPLFSTGRGSEGVGTQEGNIEGKNKEEIKKIKK